MYAKLLGIINVDFDVVYHLLISYSGFAGYWRKDMDTMGQRMSYLDYSFQTRLARCTFWCSLH
jgi:hypothetical protein